MRAARSLWSDRKSQEKVIDRGEQERERREEEEEERERERERNGELKVVGEAKAERLSAGRIIGTSTVLVKVLLLLERN